MRLIVLCALFLPACSPAALLNATVPSYDVTVTRNVAYAEGPRRRLDIYHRLGGAKAPMIVFLYGGSWRTGSKDMYRFVALPLAARGAVVVVPDYRLYPEVAFPEFLDDNARAVAWAAAHASELGGDPSRVFLVGHSAGAYNAAMLGLDPRLLAAVGYDRRRLAGVVGLAGPYDFLPITGEDIKPVFATVGDGPLSQPVSYVDGRNPPMLLLAGDADTTVNPRNTFALAEKVRAAGGSVEARSLRGIGHIGIVTAFAPLFRSRAPVLDDVWAFIVTPRSGHAKQSF